MDEKVPFYNLKDSLLGKILISNPAMPDTRFIKTVIVLLSNNKDNLLGAVLNKSSAHNFSHIIKSINTDIKIEEVDTKDSNIKISLGGPVNPYNLFVIHSNDYFSNQETITVNDDFKMTNHPSIILDLAKGEGPKESFISIGCTTWQKDQFIKEITQTDAWLISDIKVSELFSVSQEEMYTYMLDKIGLGNIPKAFFMNNKSFGPIKQ